MDINKVPFRIITIFLFPLLDNKTLGNLRQVSKYYSSLTDPDENSRILLFCEIRYASMSSAIQTIKFDKNHSYDDVVTEMQEMVEDCIFFYFSSCTNWHLFERKKLARDTLLNLCYF